MYWEDRLNEQQYAQATAAIERFSISISKKHRTNQHDLYASLTNAGLEPEEADELINLYMQE